MRLKLRLSPDRTLSYRRGGCEGTNGFDHRMGIAGLWLLCSCFCLLARMGGMGGAGSWWMALPKCGSSWTRQRGGNCHGNLGRDWWGGNCSWMAHETCEGYEERSIQCVKAATASWLRVKSQAPLWQPGPRYYRIPSIEGPREEHLAPMVTYKKVKYPS